MDPGTSAGVTKGFNVVFKPGTGLQRPISRCAWVPEPPRGARFDRHMRFVGEDGRVKVEAKTTWAIVDRASGRVLRVPKDVAAPFLAG